METRKRRRRSARRAPAERPHIPQRADELTPEWFTRIFDNGSAVTGVDRSEIGTDVGFMGEVIRCRLTWADGSGDAERPASVVVKLPTQVDENFAAGDALQSYEREIVIYQRMRDSLGLPLPRYIHGEMDPHPAPWLDRPIIFLFDHLPIGGINWVIAQFLKMSGNSKRRYVLVIEDIVDARAPSQFAGGSLDDAHRSLQVLAHFHAANWMRSDIDDIYEKIWPADRAARVFQASYVRNRDHFIERFGHVIGDDIVARLDEIQGRAPDLAHALAAEPWTLLHGDYRLDNVLFRPGGEIVVLDLQGVGRGRPAIDVAYFISTALNAEHRAEEQRLLHTYHDALVEAGVSAYSFEDLVRDCALTKELLAHRIVGSADVIDTTVTGEENGLLDVMQLRVLAWLD